MYHMSKNNIIISDSKKNNNIERQYNYYLFIMVVGGGKGELKQKNRCKPRGVHFVELPIKTNLYTTVESVEVEWQFPFEFR